MAPLVLEMKDVWKSFASPAGQVDVLRGVSLSVGVGEFVMVTGPSGSGKSTLLNLVALLDRPSRGRVVFDGVDVTGDDEKLLSDLRKHKVGTVFQRFCLLPRRSALENVLFRFRYLEMDPAEALSRSRAALAEVGLEYAADRPARLLSAGEMQRVAIARAVALRPVLLVADEPTGNLDKAATVEVMKCLQRLNGEGLTILMVTHNEGLLPFASRHTVCGSGILTEVSGHMMMAGTCAAEKED